MKIKRRTHCNINFPHSCGDLHITKHLVFELSCHSTLPIQENIINSNKYYI